MDLGRREPSSCPSALSPRGVRPTAGASTLHFQSFPDAKIRTVFSTATNVGLLTWGHSVRTPKMVRIDGEAAPGGLPFEAQRSSPAL